MSVADTKPEPIRVGVEGIAPKPIELTPARQRIDWMRLMGLPPFQMFAAEKGANMSGSLGEWLKGLILGGGEQELYDEYCRWHAQKGYWPGETPMGEVAE